VLDVPVTAARRASSGGRSLWPAAGLPGATLPPARHARLSGRFPANGGGRPRAAARNAPAA